MEQPLFLQRQAEVETSGHLKRIIELVKETYEEICQLRCAINQAKCTSTIR